MLASRHREWSSDELSPMALTRTRSRLLGVRAERVCDEREPTAVRRPAVDVDRPLTAEHWVTLERIGPVGGGDDPDLDVDVRWMTQRPRRE